MLCHLASEVAVQDAHTHTVQSGLSSESIKGWGSWKLWWVGGQPGCMVDGQGDALPWSALTGEPGSPGELVRHGKGWGRASGEGLRPGAAERTGGGTQDSWPVSNILVLG